MKWLLSDDARHELQAAYGLQPTAEQLAAFEARSRAPISSSAAGVATVDVTGILTENPSIWSMLAGGGTSYADVRAALAAADADPSVSSITLAVNSPGGSVDGLFPTLDAINSVSKPMRVRVTGQAASAAYAIASVAGPIEAAGDHVAVGSIGVATAIYTDRDVVQIASSNAPNKRPDVTTAEGRAVVQSELDDLHALFAERIARGRNTTVDRVNADFGRGGMKLAKQALSSNMIDSISQPTASARSHARAQASLKIGTGIDLSRTPGPQEQLAQLLIAKMGCDARAEGETQQQYVARVMAEVKPPEPAPKSFQELVAERVLYQMGKGPKPTKPTKSTAREVAEAFGNSIKVTTK